MCALVLQCPVSHSHSKLESARGILQENHTFVFFSRYSIGAATLEQIGPCVLCSCRHVGVGGMEVSGWGGVGGIYPQLGYFWPQFRLLDLLLISIFQLWLRPLVRLLILLPSSHLSLIIAARFSYSKALFSHSLCAQQHPFSLTCFIHSMLFSINTVLCSPPQWSPL